MLRAGGLVAFPTETVYGLGADAANPTRCARLFAVKGRPNDHPVIVHSRAPRNSTTLRSTFPTSRARSPPRSGPARSRWSSAATNDAVAPEATGGRDTVGVRVPDHPLALALLGAFGGRVAAPSANRFGRVSPTTAAHVRDDLGADVDVVLDGGPSTVGVESTIVDVTQTPPLIVRVGGIGEHELAFARAQLNGATPAPGTLPSHYAPNARVEVVGKADLDACVERLESNGHTVGELDAPDDPTEYARVLYARAARGRRTWRRRHRCGRACCRRWHRERRADRLRRAAAG